jgi:uncharacterized membrane protein YcaP (DUF421 family)
MDVVRELLGLGLESKGLTLLQICLRAVLVFIGALAIVRLANKRFLSKMSAVDVILGFMLASMLASMLARAINGSAPLFSTLAGGVFLVLLHRLFAWLAEDSDWFGRLVKGRAEILIKNGELQRETMHAHSLSDRDLIEELRQEGQINSVDEVKEAYLERSEKISVVPKKKG